MLKEGPSIEKRRFEMGPSRKLIAHRVASFGPYPRPCRLPPPVRPRAAQRLGAPPDRSAVARHARFHVRAERVHYCESRGKRAIADAQSTACRAGRRVSREQPCRPDSLKSQFHFARKLPNVPASRGDRPVIESSTLASREARFELRFTGLFSRRHEYAFPCDAAGHVDIDQLTDRGRISYFYARTVVGKELSAPVVSLIS